LHVWDVEEGSVIELPEGIINGLYIIQMNTKDNTHLQKVLIER